jgi:hypothetical protein
MNKTIQIRENDNITNLVSDQPSETSESWVPKPTHIRPEKDILEESEEYLVVRGETDEIGAAHFPFALAGSPFWKDFSARPVTYRPSHATGQTWRGRSRGTLRAPIGASAESSTASQEPFEVLNQTHSAGGNRPEYPELEASLDQLSIAAAEECFEPGIESDFAAALTTLHHRFPRSLWHTRSSAD